MRPSAASQLSIALLSITLSACDGGASSSDPAGEALERAITAHGGARALARLDDLRVTSQVTFRDGVELERRLDLRAPTSFAMTIAHGGRPSLTIGLAGDRCWKRHGPFTLPCDPEDVADHRRILDVLNARLLHGLDRSTVTAADAVSIGGVDAPAIRAGDLRLAFDPETHRLIRVDYEDDEPRVETFSDFIEVEGAQVATRHAITIGPMHDLTETWSEIVPGGADPARLAPSDSSEPGDVFDGEDAARPVAWVDVSAVPDAPTDEAERIAHAHRALLAFVEARGLRPSGTDGLLRVWPAGGGDRLAVTLEMDRVFEDLDAPPFHVETRPARRYVGVYHRGIDAPSRAGALTAALEERGVVIADGAAHELLWMPGAEEQPIEDRFGLYRVGVAAR